LDDNGVGPSNRASSPGSTSISNISLRTPVSAKGGRTYNKSKASKGSGAGPQTPVSKAGEEMYLSTLQVLLHPFFML